MNQAVAALLVSMMVSAPVFGAEIQVIVSGKVSEPIQAYTIEKDHYINAKHAASIYGAQLRWFSMAQKVQLSLRGTPIQFFIDSIEVRMGPDTVKLPRPVILRAGQVFIPIEFFLTEDFSNAAGMDTEFNSKSSLLSIDKRTSVGPLRWFTYQGFTRVVLELNKNLAYTVSKRGKSAIEVSIPFGKIEWSETVGVNDGIIQSLQLRQDMQLARLAIKFDHPAARWEKREESSPRRLIFDVALTPEDLAAGKKLADKASTQEEAEPAAPAVAPAVPGTGAAPTVKVAPPSAAIPAPAVPAPTPGTPLGAVVKPRIVVDAGHGGKDPGSHGRRGTKEKDINLKAALELAQLLKEEGAFDVTLIRSDDTFVPLADRSRKSNTFKADLFISLHCNASPRRHEEGYEIYFLSEQASDPESQRVAEVENAALEYEGKSPVDEDAAAVLSAMAKTEYINDASELAGLMTQNLAKRVDLKNRGVKQAAFYVLRGADSPAVLVEMGFLTNPREETKLESKKYRRRLIEGVYAGVLDFANRRRWLDARGQASRQETAQ